MFVAVTGNACDTENRLWQRGVTSRAQLHQVLRVPRSTRNECWLRMMTTLEILSQNHLNIIWIPSLATRQTFEFSLNLKVCLVAIHDRKIVYLGVRTCKLFLCFSPFVFVGPIC